MQNCRRCHEPEEREISPHKPRRGSGLASLEMTGEGKFKERVQHAAPLKSRFEERAVFFQGSLTARQDARNLRQRGRIPRGKQKSARSEQAVEFTRCCANSWLRPIRLDSEPPQSGFQPSLAGTI